MKLFNTSLKVLAVTLALSLGFSFASAWTGPTQAPPNGNVSAPINVSSTPQSKAGNFRIQGTTALTCNTTNAGMYAQGVVGSQTVPYFCDGSVWQRISFVAGAPAPTPVVNPSVNLTISPTAITQGQNAAFALTTSNATSCTLNGSSVPSNLINTTWSGAVAPTVTTTYTATCLGSGGGSTTRSVTVNVGGVAPTPAPTVNMSANPTSITSGGSSTLTITSSGATSCTLNPGAVAITTNTTVTRSVNPTTTTQYTVSCTGAGGTTSQSATVTVSAPLAPSVIITASPNPIIAGTGTALTVTPTNATGCWLIGGSFGSGSYGIATAQSTHKASPTTTTTYTAKCQNSAGVSVERNVTVAVNQPSVSISFVGPNRVAENQTIQSRVTFTNLQSNTCGLYSNGARVLSFGTNLTTADITHSTGGDITQDTVYGVQVKCSLNTGEVVSNTSYATFVAYKAIPASLFAAGKMGETCKSMMMRNKANPVNDSSMLVYHSKGWYPYMDCIYQQAYTYLDPETGNKLTGYRNSWQVRNFSAADSRPAFNTYRYTDYLIAY